MGQAPRCRRQPPGGPAHQGPECGGISKQWAAICAFGTPAGSPATFGAASRQSSSYVTLPRSSTESRVIRTTVCNGAGGTRSMKKEKGEIPKDYPGYMLSRFRNEAEQRWAAKYWDDSPMPEPDEE